MTTPHSKASPIQERWLIVALALGLPLAAAVAIVTGVFGLMID